MKSGVLTVRDAGSWWLSIPNSGKFIKYFVKGRFLTLDTHAVGFHWYGLKSGLFYSNRTQSCSRHG